MMKIQSIETEKKQAIESASRAKSTYFLQSMSNEDLLAIVGDEIETRIKPEKKVEDLKSLLSSMEEKNGHARKETKALTFQNV